MSILNQSNKLRYQLYLMRSLALILLVSILLSFSVQAQICAFPDKPQIIEYSRTPGQQRLLVKWDGLFINSLETSALPDSKTFHNYRSEVQKSINTDSYFLLRRYSTRGNRPEDLHNLNLVLSRQAGEINPINCLEALLLDFQIQRNSVMTTKPTEFIAYYLEKQGLTRIYLFTNDAEGVAGMGILIQALTKDVQDGWIMTGNLHNHSFFLNELSSVKPQGVLAPSGNDMKVFKAHAKQFGLAKAFITNGFQTLAIESESFPLFKSND